MVTWGRAICTFTLGARPVYFPNFSYVVIVKTAVMTFQMNELWNYSIYLAYYNCRLIILRPIIRINNNTFYLICIIFSCLDCSIFWMGTFDSINILDRYTHGVGLVRVPIPYNFHNLYFPDTFPMDIQKIEL
jgi:hypothetical protein